MAAVFKRHGRQILIGLLAVYLLVLMDLGGRSFVGHVVRILKTPEVRDLGSELVYKVVNVASGAKRRAVLALGPATD